MLLLDCQQGRATEPLGEGGLSCLNTISQKALQRSKKRTAQCDIIALSEFSIYGLEACSVPMYVCTCYSHCILGTVNPMYSTRSILSLAFPGLD